MDNTQYQSTELDRQIMEFEQQNPKIAEALRLFGLTMTTYQGAMQAMTGPRVYQSSSTTSQEQ